MLIAQKGPNVGYKHLQTCKKKWLCPICADRMARQTRASLARAIDAEQIAGYKPLFITFTAQHMGGVSLHSSGKRIRDAHRLLHSGKRAENVARDVGYDGSFRAYEVTYGASGWHFHIHELAFVALGLHPSTYVAYVMEAWPKHIAACGGYASPEHGVKVDPATATVKDYATKFGIVDELTANSRKQARGGGLLPFQLADVALNEPRRAPWARGLFQEYATATEGLKQTCTGGSIRKLFRHIKDNPEQPKYETNILASLTLEQWKKIVYSEKRAELVKAIIAHDEAAIEAIIALTV